MLASICLHLGEILMLTLKADRQNTVSAIEQEVV